MSRGYRCVIVAIVAIFLVGANHSDPKSQREQAQAQSQIAASLRQIASAYDQQAERAQGPDKQTEPCQRGDDRRYSDLCAQWKAADAASDSAWWAWASGILGTLSLVGVFAALCLTFHSNRIARDTAKTQLRAYVGIEGIKVVRLEPHSPAEVEITIGNSGQTPASNVSIRYVHGFREASVTEFSREVGPEAHGNLLPNCKILTSYLNKKQTTLQEMAYLEAGHILYFCWGEINYTDIFGAQHQTLFRYFYGDQARMKEHGAMAAWHTGNSIT